MDFPREAAQHATDSIDSRGYVLTNLAAARSPPVTLPFDKGYIEVLKESYPDRSYYGGPTHECPYCSAVFWFQEHVKSATANATRKIVYNLCCRGGKINYKPYKKPPAILADLLRFNGDARSERFLRQIRSYNSLFAFTSLGATVNKAINNGTAPEINGGVHHRIGIMLPRRGA